MTIDRAFQTRNARELTRLRAVVSGLNEAELGRSLGHRWTVADALAHVAFWDLRAVALIERFEREGIGPSPMDVEIANETVRELTQTVPPRVLADLAVRAAETAARRIEALPDALVAAIRALPEPPFALDRHRHWQEHLDDIERGVK